MKRTLSLVLVLVLTLCAMIVPSAYALNYKRTIGNEATFETLAEARVNALVNMKDVSPNIAYYATVTYASHPALDGYPGGDTTYIYRSPNMYGGNAGVRMNTNLVVFSDKHFDTRDDAYDYLEALGLIDIINQAIGSIVLVTPSNPNAGFGAADQKGYYQLQTVMFAQGASGSIDGQRVTYVEPVYYGGYSFFYVIGLDGGATFLNNYVSSTLDYVSRIGGMLLINSKMDRVRNVAAPVPVYLVNAAENVIEKYEAANHVNAVTIRDGKYMGYCQAFPLQRVVSVTAENPDVATLIHDAYYNFFIKAQRAQSTQAGLISASTPFQGYGQDCAPYSLVPRSALIDGKTAEGIYEFVCVEERFADIKNEKGEYLQTWYEYLPEAMVNGTAAPGSIPLILTNHGGGDDPLQFVDGNGYLELAGREGFAMVAPYHQSIGYGPNREYADGSVMHLALPALVEHILEKYPALDASRVYVTGYSMGAGATMRAIYGDSSLFAAAAPQAVGRVIPTDEMIEQYKDVDIPIFFTTSEYDIASMHMYEPSTNTLGAYYYEMLDMFLDYNDMAPLGDLDYDKYPIVGFPTDYYNFTMINGEYENRTWFINNDDGIPMIGLNITMNNVHALYPPYAELVWNYFKHFSRDVETGEILYDPYVY